jgi:hypothetical protein
MRMRHIKSLCNFSLIGYGFPKSAGDAGFHQTKTGDAAQASPVFDGCTELR